MSFDLATAAADHVDPWRATEHERPVFYDAAGHRARVVRAIGGVTGAASAAALTLIVTGVLGFATVPTIDRAAVSGSAAVTHAHHAIRPHLVTSGATPVAATSGVERAVDLRAARLQRSRRRAHVSRLT